MSGTVFKYKKGEDSVLVVGEDDYKKCKRTNPIKTLNDGDSVFKFDRSGPFYFISGHDHNCDKGLKMVIVVIADRRSRRNLPPPPPPSSSPSPSPAIKPAPPTHHSPSPSPHVKPPSHHSPSPAVTPTPRPSHSPSPSPVPESKRRRHLPSLLLTHCRHLHHPTRRQSSHYPLFLLLHHHLKHRSQMHIRQCTCPQIRLLLRRRGGRLPHL